MAPGNKLTEYYVKQELRNLNMEDAHRRHIAMNALTKHVQQLDGNEVPNFLKQVSQALHKSKPTSISCHVNAISLYEQAVRRNGASLVCQLGIIICMLRTALNLVGFNTTLQQACVKLVRSIAHYVICTSENRERGLIEEIKGHASFNHHAVHSCGDSGSHINSLQKTHAVYCQQILKDLCSPLLEKVGEAPRCLHALVETPGWQFASQDLVNQACLQATRGLLMKGSQAVGHMQLIRSLAKKNGLALKPHVGTLLKAVAEILGKGSDEHNWQQRLCSVQMINGFVKISSAFELQEIIGVLERQREDKMPCVRKVVAETIHRAKLVLENQCFQVEERICNSVVLSCSSEESTGSNEHESMEGYGDSDVKPVSGFHSEWSVRNNPIAGDEIQGNLIVPVFTNGKDIIVDLKGEIIVEGLGLLWGSENYPGRRQAFMQEKCCCGESSDVERSEEISSVSSVNMDTVECPTDLEETERHEKSSSKAHPEAELEEATPIVDREPEFEEVPLTGNGEEIFKEDKSCYSDLVNTGVREKLSSNGQVEVLSTGNCEKKLEEDESFCTDLEDAEEHEKLSSDGKAEAELEKILPTDNCEKMIKEDPGRHENLSSKGDAKTELEVLPIGKKHEKLSSNVQAETEFEEQESIVNCEKVIKEDPERHENLSSNGEAETELEEVQIWKRSNGEAEAELEEQELIGNCVKVIKEDPERLDNLSSNGKAETELEEVPIGKRHENLSSNGQADPELEEVPIGNYEKMIKEDPERHENSSSNGKAETELEEVPIGKGHEKLSSNGKAEAELKEVLPIGNCEKMIKEDPGRHENLSSSSEAETEWEQVPIGKRLEKLSSNGQAEAKLEEHEPIGNYEKMIKEDPERHENLSSETEAELEEVLPTGNCEKMIKQDPEGHENLSSNGEAETELEEVPIGKRHEKLSSNGQAEAELEDQVPIGNCEKMINEDPERHEKLPSKAEVDLKEVVPIGNCAKIIKEEAEGYEKLSSIGKAETELEEVPIGKRHEKMSSNGKAVTDLEEVPIGKRHELFSSNSEAQAGLEEVVSIGNHEEIIKEDPGRHEKLSSEAASPLKEVVPIGNCEKMIKEDAERNEKSSRNSDAEAEAGLEEVISIGNCEKMIKEDPGKHEKLSSKAETLLKEVVPIGYCEKMIKEDMERHQKLSSNGKTEAELEEVPIGNCENMIKEDAERHEKLSNNGKAEAEFKEVPIGSSTNMIKEETERHEKFSSNGKAEAELEEVVPIENCDKMLREDTERHENLSSSGKPEDEFEDLAIGNCKEFIKEDRERHDNLPSNGQAKAEAEIEEVLPIGNYEKMLKEDKSSAYGWSMKMGQISLSSVCSRWSKAAGRVELILGISLCGGLIVSAAMFSIKSFLIHEDSHILVPT